MLNLKRARDRGRLLGLASVEILLAGFAVTLQGISIIYEPDGSLLVQRPRFRHPDGHWLPAVEVLDAFGARAPNDQGEANY